MLYNATSVFFFETPEIHQTREPNNETSEEETENDFKRCENDVSFALRAGLDQHFSMDTLGRVQDNSTFNRNSVTCFFPNA